VRESTIEQRLRTKCREHGAMCLKFTSPGRRAVPDRIVLGRFGHVFFVELKAPGKKPSEAQAAEHDRLRALGFRVYVADTYFLVDDIIAREFAHEAPL